MADENLHAKHRARMQERVERDGLDSLAEHEALEYLLFLSIPRADTNALAHRLIQHFGDFCKVLEAEPEELMQVEGVGPKSARLISTVMACSRYYELKKRKTRLSLNSAETAIAYVKPLFRGVQNEQLYLILLDDACRPVHIGLTLVDVKIQDAEPPTQEVIEAFKAVETAKQQAETVINDAKAYQNAQLPQAQAQADKLTQNAEYLKQKRINEAVEKVAMFEAMYSEYAQNPAITRTRMYYETISQVLPGVKLYINTGAQGGDVQMLLPLESLAGTEGGNVK